MTVVAGRVVVTSGCAVLVLAALTSCRTSGDEGRMPATASAPILLFNGTGASPADVVSVRSILASQHLDYSQTEPEQLPRSPHMDN